MGIVLQNENIVGGIDADVVGTFSYNSLTTTDKTLPGAINELNNKALTTVSLTQQEYDALPSTKLSDDIAYYITDGTPDVDNSLWTKVGTATLNTTAKDCSGAINEHESDINQLNSKLNSCGMIAYSDTITISANSSKEIDLSSLLPNGATLKGISSVSLGGYALPYIESGVVKTYVYAVNTATNKITIQNNTSAWTSYALNFVIFYTTT